MLFGELAPTHLVAVDGAAVAVGGDVAVGDAVAVAVVVVIDRTDGDTIDSKSMASTGTIRLADLERRRARIVPERGVSSDVVSVTPCLNGCEPGAWSPRGLGLGPGPKAGLTLPVRGLLRLRLVLALGLLLLGLGPFLAAIPGLKLGRCMSRSNKDAGGGGITEDPSLETEGARRSRTSSMSSSPPNFLDPGCAAAQHRKHASTAPHRDC